MLTRTFCIVGHVLLLYSTASWPAQATRINPPVWANFLSPFTGHTPPSEQFVKSDGQRSGTLNPGKATRVRKMSGDESEMFLPHFWDFEPLEGNGGQLQDLNGPTSRFWPDASTSSSSVHTSTDSSNASVLYPLQAPLALHSEQQTSKDAIFGRLSRAILHRDNGFKCPDSSLDCSSIGRPNSCCSVGLACQLIQDTGQGDVGCCSEGQTCDGVAQCAPGYSGCPGSNGGGCCLPGFECYGIGCAKGSTVTLVIDPTVTVSPTSTSPLRPTPAVPTQSTNSIVVPAPLPTTTSSTPTPSTTSSTPSITVPSSTQTTSPSASNTVIPPVRPTSVVTSTVTDSNSGSCPTGYYQCSAYYRGHCCAIGRDCSVSDCPASASTTVADTHSVTIVAPTGNGIGAANVGLGTGRCATGWSSCAASLGGGCCPNGYDCGSGPSCLAAQATETPSSVAKEPASGGTKLANPHHWLAAIICAIFPFVY